MPCERITLRAGGATLDWSPPGPARGGGRAGALLVLPGAGCAAGAYRWLAPLAEAAGFGCAWLETPPPGAGAPALVKIPAVIAAVAALRTRLGPGGRLWAVGHSWGGAMLLECLDPAEARHNPRSEAPADFAGLADFEAVATLGTTLQPQAAAMRLPYRDARRALARPSTTRVLLVAGGCDGMATPPLVEATAARYAPPLPVEVLPGASHFGWVHAAAAARPSWDGAARLSPAQQAARTLSLLEAFFH